ncbi:MAG: hypothetical protein PVG75_02400 [Thioalkalispiraceae bacterium]|jgi:hypothetical protein
MVKIYRIFVPAYLALQLSFFIPLCTAGELLHSYVNEDNDRYVLHLDMRINAEYDDVYLVLMDFSKMPEINDSVTSARLLESNGKQHTLVFVTEGCIWFFCESVKQVATVSELGQGYILTKADPEKSNLRYGKSLWQVIDEGETTRVKYNAEYIPDFWVPPIFGSSILQSRLLKEGQKTIHGIERLSSPLGNSQ